MPLELLGLGTANPLNSISREEGLGIARVLSDPVVGRSTFLPDIYAGSGVQTRYMVHTRQVVRDVLDGTRHSGSPFLPGPDPLGPSTAARMKMYAEFAPALAIQAAERALADSGLSTDSVTHLVLVSCTGFVAPGADEALIRGLKLRPDVQRVQVGYMGCHGAINGLRTCMAFASDAAAVVLMVAVELCSLHYYYGMSADKVVANALFADGAAAVVGKGSREPENPERPHVTATGSCLFPGTAGLMGWVIGDHGFEMVLSKKIPTAIEAGLGVWLSDWLKMQGLSVSDVGSWAVHPGGPKILDATESGLGLPSDALTESRGVLADFGNMSSPTVLFIIDRLRKRNAPRPWVLLGFGPGLMAEVALIR
jgi:predicted naringenin-chalcone synthase